MEIALDKAETLQSKLSIVPAGPTAIELERATRNKRDARDPDAAAVNAEIDRMKAEVSKKQKAIEDYAKLGPIRQKEFANLRNQIIFYQEALKQLKVQATEIEVANILLQLFYYYEGIEEAAIAKSKTATLSKSDQEAAHKTSLEAQALKVMFGDAFGKKQESSLRDIDYITSQKSKAAKERLQLDLAKNLVLSEGNSNFTADYNSAQRVLATYIRETLEANPMAKYFNPEYLSADPFLTRGHADVQEMYKDIPYDDWQHTIPGQLYEAILHCLVPAHQRQTVSQFFVKPKAGQATADDTVYVYLSANGVSLRGKGSKILWLNLDETNPECVRFRSSPGVVTIPFVNEDVFAALDSGLYKQIIIDAFTKISSVFGRLSIYSSQENLADQKMLGRKRFLRIIDQKIEESRLESKGKPTSAIADQIGRAKAAVVLAQIEGCPDGVFTGLDQFEAERAGSRTSSETDISSNISSIFSGYAFKFCKKFIGLNPDYMEWQANIGQYIKQRTFFSLPHQGVPRTRFYMLPASVLAFANLYNDFPGFLMHTFLTGGQIRFGASTINFDPFNAEKAISLVFEAYEAGNIISKQCINDFINRDLYLRLEYKKFEEGEYEENPDIDPGFFEHKQKEDKKEGDKKDEGIHFRRPLFEYILERLGYIINPTSSLKRKKAEIAAKVVEDKERLLDLEIIDENGTPILGSKFELDGAKSTLRKAINSNKVIWNADGTIHVTTDKSTYAYQLMSDPIPVNKLVSLRIPFEVNLEQGGFGVGLLSGDQKRFLTQKNFDKVGLAQGVVELPAGSSEEHVILVFYNNVSKEAVSKFTVQSLIKPLPVTAEETRKIEEHEEKIFADRLFPTFKKTGVPNTVKTKESGYIEVTTDVSTYAYQLMSGAIHIDKSAPLRIPFEVNLEQGGFGVGILSGDQSRFISQQSFSKLGLAKGVLELPAGSSEEEVLVVFYNNSPQAAVSKFTIKSQTALRLKQERALDIKTFKTSGVPNTIDKKADGTLQVTTDKSTYAYQVMSGAIPVDKSAPLRIPFEVNVEQGGVGVGLLSGDQTRFLSQQNLSKLGLAQGVLEIPAGLSEEKVFLVFYNNSPKAGVSKFTILGIR